MDGVSIFRILRNDDDVDPFQRDQPGGILGSKLPKGRVLTLGCFFNTSFFKMKPSRFAKFGVPGGSGRQGRHLNRQVRGGLI